MAYDPEARLRYCIEQDAKRKAEEYQRYLDQGSTPKKSWEEEMYVNAEHPNTMENGTATFFYIATMIIGAIFVDRILIWGMASFIYFSFITRKARRQKKWDEMQEKKNGGHK